MSKPKTAQIAKEWFDSLEDQTVKAMVHTLIETEKTEAYKRGREDEGGATKEVARYTDHCALCDEKLLVYCPQCREVLCKPD